MDNPVFNIAISQSERAILLPLLRKIIKTYIDFNRSNLHFDIIKGIVSDLESVVFKLESTFGRID